ncbi:hypothetical protein N9954_07965, partial [Maribacter sp.]|nr:hypothetical protein [Maribacter sp.]
MPDTAKSDPSYPIKTTKKPLITVSQLEVFKNRKRILSNPLPFHNERFEKHGDTFMVHIGPSSKVVFTRNAESIKHILQK